MDRQYTIQGKVKLSSDQHVWVAIVNLIGSSIFYGLVTQFGLVGFVAFFFVIYLVVAPSWALAFLRIRMTMAVNSTRRQMIATLNSMIKAEQLNTKKKRKIYINYVDLLVKKMDNLVDIMAKRRQALDIAQNSKIGTVIQVAQLEQMAQSYEKKKIFLNK